MLSLVLLFESRRKIPSLVQHAPDLNARVGHAVENCMRMHGNRSKFWHYFVARPPQERSLSELFTRLIYFAQQLVCDLG